MDSFSQREYGIKPIQIVDEAPAWLRTSFFKRVYKRMCIPPAISRRLLEKLSGRLQEAYGSRMHFGDHEDLLEILLQEVEWFYFYDALEFVACHLRFAGTGAPNDLTPQPSDVFEHQFRKLVNELFEDCNVGWTLDLSGLLKRKLGNETEELLDELCKNNFLADAPQLHLRKARQKLDRSSTDFENSIKESICALESVGRATFPGASTFGDVLKELRKQHEYRNEMISILQKAYEFSNSTPGVRHAGAEVANASRSEAEYVYLLSLASIKYLGAEGII